MTIQPFRPLSRLLILCTCLWLSFLSDPALAENSAVTKTVTPVDSVDLSTIATYTLKEGDCALIWEVCVHKDDDQTITLRPRRPLGLACERPFAEQLPLHRQILQEVFSDWPKARFSTLFIGPLETMAPTGIWNVRVALASAKSSEWQDWREHYPDHESGKSINQLFVELVNEANACRELNALFAEFGLKIKLTAVEKVFAQPATDLSFYSQLQAQGLTGNPRVIYDAGMIYFSMTVF